MIPVTAMLLTGPASTTLTFQVEFKRMFLGMSLTQRSLSSKLLSRRLGLPHRMNGKMRR
jgi:hypothetical protein